MQRAKLSAADLERIAEMISAAENAWRSTQPSQPALHSSEDTGWFTAEELRPPDPVPPVGRNRP